MPSIMPTGKQQFTNNAGVPLAGGKVFTFEAGTSTPKATYQDAAGTVESSNPIVLNARGEALVFWHGAYDVKVTDANGITIYTVSNYQSPVMLDDLSADDGTDKIAGTWAGNVKAKLSDLATLHGSSLIGDGEDTIKGALDALRLTGYAALRAYEGPQSSVYITGFRVSKSPSGIAGFFARDDNDKTTPDNGGWCIVDAKNRRWKRPNSMTVNPLWFGAIDDYTGTPGTSTDNAAAINAAIASFPAQGSPTWRSWTLELTATGAGKGYYVGSTINVKNQQFGRLIGKAAKLIGNFNGTVLQLGDLSGANDILWFHIEGLDVEQESTGPNTRAVVMQHAYACTVDKCYFYGGQFAFVLDGNANEISATTFRKGISANVAAGSGANNEANFFNNCSSELSDGYGYDLSVDSGLGGFTHIIGGYIERNGIAGVRVRNNQNFRVDGVYFNLQNSAAGVLLDGTVGPSYPDGYGVVQNCRITGPVSGTSPKFIKEASANSINCSYNRNEVESGSLCDLYGSASHCVNLGRRGNLCYLRNAVDFTDANADGVPDNWTRQGTGAVAVTSSVSVYGAGNAVAISPDNQYIYQDIKFPSNVLLRISGWAKTTGADGRIELWDSAMSGAYATGKVSTATPTRIEFYVSTAQLLPGITTAKLMLRTRDSGTASFSDLMVEDMTN